MTSGVNRRSLSHRSIVIGAFIGMSGVKGSTRSEVADALREFALSKGGVMEPASPQAEPFNHLLIAGDENCPITVLYPDSFFAWAEASSFLSVSLDAPVFSFHIHDGDLWMYALFVNGEAVDHFNPIPDYWSDEVSPEERSLWMGDADVVSDVWKGVDVASIEKYLVVWNLEEEESGKAYESDRFAFDDCWQITDFMGKLGLSYPIDDDGKIHGDWYRFDVKVEA